MQGEMGRGGMGRNRRSAARQAMAAALLGMAAPALAQFSFSDSYNFLKAVRDRDGTKVTDALNKPGNSMLSAYDPATGETALHIIAKRRDATYLSFLIGRGADPNLRDKSGASPLLVAAQLGWTDGVTLMLQNGGRIDLDNNSGETPLIMAVHNRDLPMVRLLITSGADPKRVDRIAGKSALDYAREDPRGASVLKIVEEAPARRPAFGPQVAGPHQ